MFKLCITGDLGFEVWKDIPGYEGYYKASTYGRIKSLSRNTTNGKILKQAKDSNGYLVVSLSKNGKVKKSPCAPNNRFNIPEQPTKSAYNKP